MRVATIVRTISALVVLMFLCSVPASAQYHKERRHVRQGNSSFERKNYKTSYNRYNEALEHDSTSYEALYNRANAYTHMRRSNPKDSTLVSEVEFGNYEAIAADMLLTKSQRAEVLRNLGESLFNEQKYEAALNAFRESLLLNPDDKETKYNYVLTKRIVDQKRKQQQQNENQDNNDQNNQENNQDNNDQANNQNNQDQQQNEGDQNGDNKNDPQSQNNPPEQDEQQGGDEPKDEEQEGEQDGEQKPEPKELNADQERMLNAIQAEEDKTQEKLKEGEKVLVVPGKKNW